MANVLIWEAYLEDIADAIRAQNGGSDTYTPAQMAQAILDLVGGSPTLGTGTFTYNGTFLAADDNLDGYSQVTVSRQSNLHPIAYDITNGYVNSGTFTIGGSGYYSDVYEVEAGRTYRIEAGSSYGNLFRVMYSATNPAEATTNVVGTQIANATASSSSLATWTASADGYLTFTKTSASASGKSSNVFDMTLTEDL